MTVLKTEKRIRYEHYTEPVTLEAAMLNIQVETGHVYIQSHDLPCVDVEARLRDVDVLVWREDDCVFVTAENSRSPLASGETRPKADLMIRVPAKCELLAHITTGAVDVKDIVAGVRTHVITGQTRLQNLGARITASSVTGSIAYEGQLADDTHRFAATTGILRLALQEPPNARIYAWATSGQVHCDIPLSYERRGGYPTGDHLYGVAGSGVGRILAEVVTGSVHIVDYLTANNTPTLMRRTV